LSASASAASFTNACRNSAVGTNWDQINVTNTATSPAGPVAPGSSVTLSNIHLQISVPGAIFAAGYNLGLLTAGQNNVPATVHEVIDASNTVQLSQSTNSVDTTLSTTISDPDGVPGTGDETATDASASVDFNDQTWTAGASGTINFIEHPDPLVNGAVGGGIIAVAHLGGGAFNVQFHCTEGTVTGSNPGVPTFPLVPTTITSTTIQAPNQAPTANAGPDQTVNSGSTVTLDGSGSTDPENDALTYAWSQDSGPAVTLSDASAVMPTFTAPTGPATLGFTLQVCDPSNACDTDSVTINVNSPANQAPTADAGPDQTVASGAAVTLDGSGSSDPDGDALTYAWSQSSGPAVTLSDASAVMPTFTAPTGPATLAFDLQVCDPSNACDTDSVTINVNAPPPVVDIAMDVIVNGPTSSTKTSKSLVAKVTNMGTASQQVCDTDISWAITVNGTPTTGSVAPKSAGCKTLSPGASTRMTFVWTYGAGEVTSGATVDYTGTVSIAGDANAGNNSDTETRTAK